MANNFLMYLIQVYKSATQFNKQSKDWSGAEQDFGKIIEKTIGTESEMIEWLNNDYPNLSNVERNRWLSNIVERSDGLMQPSELIEEGKKNPNFDLFLCDYDIYIYETKEYEGDLKT